MSAATTPKVAIVTPALVSNTSRNMGLHQKIIGGMFGLEPETSPRSNAGCAPPPCLAFPHAMFATARCALHCLLEHARPRQVWFPSYLCASMLQSVRPGTARIRFFPVDESLLVSGDTWLKEVLAGDVVVFIDYFGFAGWSGILGQAQSRGAIVVEDAAQAFLAGGFSATAEYLIFSPRKFVGVPDGGILVARVKESLPSTSLRPAPSDWWQDALHASELRRKFDQHGGERAWFELFQKTEAGAPVGNHAMSDVSRGILLNEIDYAAVSERRRANYRFLAGILGRFALFPELPQAVVPLGFPVRVPNRDGIRQKLFAAEIYPPVHWPIQGVVPDHFAASHRLAREIMTLPCDQRYEAPDMERMADCFLKAL